jgi:phosphate transport system permease protein
MIDFHALHQRMEVIMSQDTAVIDAAGGPPGDSRPRRRPRSAGTLGDRLFRGGARSSGLLVLAIMASVGLFLLLRGYQALSAVGPLKFLTTQAWNPDVHNFGIAAVLIGSVFIAIVAIVIAVPLALGTALFITEIARGWFQRTLISLVDLMAAVPSVVYGLWGLFFLQANVVGLAKWISTWLGWIPIFAVTGADPSNPLASDSVYTASTFVAGLTVALMVAPIACSIMREVFTQAPMGEREGAYALGATRWGMISTVVLPFGRGGVIGGTMLGLGRALGETIAVYMIISPVFTIQPHILQDGTNSVSALIALRYGDSDAFGLSALMAAGLALFVLTLIVNFTASLVVARSRSGAQSEV